MVAMGTKHRNRENHKYGAGFYSGETRRDLDEIDDRYFDQAFKEAHKLLDSIMAGKASRG
jgi:hypothetical protein